MQGFIQCVSQKFLFKLYFFAIIVNSNFAKGILAWIACCYLCQDTFREGVNLREYERLFWRNRWTHFLYKISSSVRIYCIGRKWISTSFQLIKLPVIIINLLLFIPWPILLNTHSLNIFDWSIKIYWPFHLAFCLSFSASFFYAEKSRGAKTAHLTH